MPSIVIPAHNEANGIERCLRALLADNMPDLVVVVVANACKDETASRARSLASSHSTSLAPRIHVIDTPQGGKTNAMNLGERYLREQGLDRFPRLFLDADIELAPGALRALLDAVRAPGPRVVAATPEFDSTACTLAVRLYYAAERFNPYHFSGAPNGSGTYCVNAEGRARWGEFPEVLADDGYVERCFAASERATVPVTARVRVPRTIAALRRVAARVRLGTAELDRISPLRPDQRGAGGTFGAVAARLAPNPFKWPALAVWTWLKLLERLESRKVASKQGTDRWQQDASSRA
jgi:glycosyltransferase involved in cell wall biosynthesis